MPEHIQLEVWFRNSKIKCLDWTVAVSPPALPASPLQDNRQCGVYNSAFEGHWQSLSCESALPYICKKTPDDTRRAEPLGESAHTAATHAARTPDMQTASFPPQMCPRLWQEWIVSQSAKCVRGVFSACRFRPQQLLCTWGVNFWPLTLPHCLQLDQNNVHCAFYDVKMSHLASPTSDSSFLRQLAVFPYSVCRRLDGP